MTNWLDRGPRDGSILMLMLYAAAVTMVVLIPLWILWWRGVL